MLSAVNLNVDEQPAKPAMPAREDLIRAHYRLQEGRFFTAVNAGEGAIHAGSDLTPPMWNHSMWLGEDFPGFLQAVEQFHQEHDRRPCVYLVDADARAWEASLTEAGYERFDRETWMARDTNVHSESTEDLVIEGATELDDFARVFAGAFNALAPQYEVALRRELTGQRNLIGRVGGEAVVVGSVAVEGELACIYNVGVDPRFRGKGAGRAMMNALIQAAREEGCQWVFLQVEAGSGAERLYARLGFRPLFTRVGFRKTQWSASQSECALSKALGFRGKVGGALLTETRAIPAELAGNEKNFSNLWAELLRRYGGSVEDCGIRFEANRNQIELTWRGDLFSREVIRRMANQFVTLMESFVREPGKPLRELEMFTAAEREQLLGTWSAGPKISWNGQSIVRLIEAQAKRSPEAVAISLAEANEAAKNPRLNYRELLERASRRSCALARAGVTRGAAVGVLLPRSMEVVISMLAIWRLGAVFVPLDSSYPPERTAFMAKDSGMKAVVTDKMLEGSAPAGIAKILVGGEEGLEAASVVELTPEDAAYVIYTSGSTGQPKGVSISHGALAQHVVAMREFYGVTAKDRHLHFSPFTFDASFEQLLPPLIAGASVTVRDERLWDVAEFVRNVAEFQLTMVDVPMAYWHQLAQHATELTKAPQSLRLVIAGGEAMAVDRLAQWQRGAFAKCRLVNAYGPTEATITATAFDAANFNGREAGVSSVPIGRAIAGRRVYILGEDLKPVPARVAGQLLIGGPLLASGYLNRPELTNERFIANPFSEGRLYRTGDIARFLEDGSIEFLGRADDQVKIRGFRIELGEIESALQAHPKVREAVVVAKGESGEQKRLIAYATSKGEKITEREARVWLRDRLPEYMVPSAFVFLDEFPLLNSGKVNRKALPAPVETEVEGASVAGPKNPLELQLQITFQRVLRRGGVGVDESFFDLGGDSLQALELIVQIEKVTGRRLPLETLFQTPTVERLAAQIQKGRQEDVWSSLVPLQKNGSRAPIYWIHTTPGDVLGYGNLIHHLGADQPSYGFQALGLKEGEKPHRTIEEMAAYYIGLLREFQPEGPYNLAGWCFGGIVAVEMAQQLRASGQEVNSLLLMETNSAGASVTNLNYHFHRLKALVTMSPERWRQYLTAKVRYSEMDNRMRFRHATENVDAEQKRWLARLEDVYNANLAALENYRSKYYDGKVTLFNALERDPGVLPDPNYGWVGLAREIEIHEVAGNHDTMLAEPNVASLAEAMRNALSKTHYASRR